MQWQGQYDEVNNRPTTITLGASVKAVPCKYGCGSLIIVTTMTRKAPHHFECGLKASRDCMLQMKAKSGPYYDKWLAAMNDPAYKSRYIMGMRLYVERISRA